VKEHTTLYFRNERAFILKSIGKVLIDNVLYIVDGSTTPRGPAYSYFLANSTNYCEVKSRGPRIFNCLRMLRRHCVQN
jgi:hypothetical protein